MKEKGNVIHGNFPNEIGNKPEADEEFQAVRAIQIKAIENLIPEKLLEGEAILFIYSMNGRGNYISTGDMAEKVLAAISAVTMEAKDAGLGLEETLEYIREGWDDCRITEGAE